MSLCDDLVENIHPPTEKETLKVFVPVPSDTSNRYNKGSFAYVRTYILICTRKYIYKCGIFLVRTSLNPPPSKTVQNNFYREIYKCDVRKLQKQILWLNVDLGLVSLCYVWANQTQVKICSHKIFPQWWLHANTNVPSPWLDDDLTRGDNGTQPIKTH